MKKAELRTLYLERQRSLQPGQFAEWSRKISDNFFKSVDLQGISLLHCFIPIEKFGEIDTLQIFRRVWEKYPTIRAAAPRVNFESGEIESVSFTAESRLTKNKWGINEPDAMDAPDVDEKISDADIDLVLVPLLCFDETGHRVGYGRGFYDRFLARCRNDCKKVGLSFFGPIKTIEDVVQNDIALDLFITPDGPFQPR